MRGKTQGLTSANGTNPMTNSVIRSRLLNNDGSNREVSERRQVGDAESMVNEAKRKRETAGVL